MAQLHIARNLDLNDEQVSSLAQRVTEKLSGLGIGMEWTGEEAKLEGRGVSGECLLNNNRVEIDLQLDFMASMFRDTIEKQLNRYLDELG